MAQQTIQGFGIAHPVGYEPQAIQPDPVVEEKAKPKAKAKTKK